MKAILAGYGHQGKVYADKLIKNADEWGVQLVAIADPSPSTLASAPTTVQHYSDVNSALRDLKADIVINTANNHAHIEIIRTLQDHPSVRGYLTEKPLVGEAENEEEANQRLQNHFVSMNMVTNFSEAAEELQFWHEENPQWKLVGIDSVWGKDRRRDTRPTTGIANDIVHPVGLIQSIFKPREWNLHSQAQGLYGELSKDRDGNELSCVFHYHAKFITDVAPVVIDASYAWKSQHRRVTAFFVNNQDRYIAAELFLDELEDDSDRRSDFLRLSTFDDQFVPHIIHESDRSSNDKLETYLAKSFDALHNNMSATEAGLVGLAEEAAIGRVFSLLHPSTDFDALKADPNLKIWEASPDAVRTPKSPQFPVLSEYAAYELQARVRHFQSQSAVDAPTASFIQTLEQS